MKRIIVLLAGLFLTACAGLPSAAVATETPTSTPVPTATATMTPTPEPTPIGGGGRIILTVPYALYKETHPELGEGRHLFLFDLSKNSLTPLATTAEAYNNLTNISPNGDFLVFESSSDSQYMQNCSFYIMNLTSGEVSLIAAAIETHTCQNTGDRPTWLSDNALAYVAIDGNGINRIYLSEPGLGKFQPISPDDKSVRGFTVVTPNGPFYWSACWNSGTSCGIYETSMSGETSELDVNITQESAPEGIGKWIYQRYSGAGTAHGSWGFFRLRLPNKTENLLIEDLFEGDLPRGFQVYIQSWSPDQGMALVRTSDYNLNTYLGSYIWDIENAILSDFDLDVHPEYRWHFASWTPDNSSILIVVTPRNTNGDLESGETALQVYSVETGGLASEISAPWADISYPPTYSPDGRLALFISPLNEPTIVDLQNLEPTSLILPLSWINTYRAQPPGPTCILVTESRYECTGEVWWITESNWLP